MSKVDRLNELVAVLINQLALTQYRLAILESGSEAEGRRQMQMCLKVSAAMLEGVEPHELLDDELEAIDRMTEKLIATLELTRSIN